MIIDKNFDCEKKLSSSGLHDTLLIKGHLETDDDIVVRGIYKLEITGNIKARGINADCTVLHVGRDVYTHDDIYVRGELRANGEVVARNIFVGKDLLGSQGITASGNILTKAGEIFSTKDIKAGGTIETQQGIVYSANGLVKAGKSITSCGYLDEKLGWVVGGTIISSKNDIIAGTDIRAYFGIAAGRDISAGQKVISKSGFIAARNNITARKVLAGGTAARPAIICTGGVINASEKVIHYGDITENAIEVVDHAFGK